MIRDFLVSVVIVNYNGKTLIKRCVDTIFQNQYASFKIIIVDNGFEEGDFSYFYNKLVKAHRIGYIKNWFA